MNLKNGLTPNQSPPRPGVMHLYNVRVYGRRFKTREGLEAFLCYGSFQENLFIF